MRTFLTLCLAALAISVQAEDVFKNQRERWLKIAEDSKPALIKTVHQPQRTVKAVQDDKAYQGWRYETDQEMTPQKLKETNFRQVREVTLDLGDHLTGYLQLNLLPIDSDMDAPTRLRIMLGEVPAEMNTPLDPWAENRLARSWMQDEVVTFTLANVPYTVPRRLSGRYLNIQYLGGSITFDFGIDISFTSETSARTLESDGLTEGCPQVIRDIDRIGKATLRECMQTVYEDGPKRDRRLWIGDMYLESLANRYSFQNHQLTKRCLYLFAGLARENGILYANCFEYPKPHPQRLNYMISYNLLYIMTLLEYYRDTKDDETAQDLWPVVRMQLEDALVHVDNFIFNPDKQPQSWNFFDHRAGINTDACLQALIIDALKASHELGMALGKTSEVKGYPALVKRMTEAARKHLLDKKTGLIVSGKDRQVSVISQAWMIRAGVLNQKEGQKALTTVLAMPESVKPSSPYATHYLIEAMLLCGMEQEARTYLTDYWGGMVSRGADTFFEAYDPENDLLSPYGFSPLNSYCHAWSCTPIYFIHKYPEIFQTSH